MHFVARHKLKANRKGSGNGDTQQPCGNCVERGQEKSCSYPSRRYVRRLEGDAHAVELDKRLARLESVLAEQSTLTRVQGPAPAVYTNSPTFPVNRNDTSISASDPFDNVSGTLWHGNQDASYYDHPLADVATQSSTRPGTDETMRASRVPALYNNDPPNSVLSKPSSCSQPEMSAQFPAHSADNSATPAKHDGTFALPEDVGSVCSDEMVSNTLFMLCSLNHATDLVTVELGVPWSVSQLLCLFLLTYPRPHLISVDMFKTRSGMGAKEDRVLQFPCFSSRLDFLCHSALDNAQSARL